MERVDSRRNQKKILVVDDEEINRSILCDILGGAYAIVEAENGKQAVEQLQQLEGEIALILLDLVMPAMNGFQVLREMKNRGWLNKIPVIVLSGGSLREPLERAYDLGADDHLVRPFSAWVVRRRVAHNLMLYNQHQQLVAWIMEHMNQIQKDEQRDPERKASARTLKLVEKEWEKYRFFSSMSKEIQFEYHVSSDVIVLSEGSANYLGISEVRFHPWNSEILNQVVYRRDMERLTQLLKHATPEKPMVEYNCSINVKGERRWGKFIVQTMWSGAENPVWQGVLGKFVDTHEEHSRIQVLEQLASHDSLTGLLNHDAARNLICRTLSEYTEKQYALAVIDLDRFKEANDRYGHQFGDQVLKYIAEKLRRSIRSSDLAARVGGDEFLVFMEYADRSQAERVFRTLSGFYGNFEISISMGVALSTKGVDYEVLFRRADRALYAAKRKGRNLCCFYDDSMEHLLSVLSPIESDAKPEGVVPGKEK
ncbi:MAG: diguanylate cyclase [Lawsonibacter sp.]